MPDLFDPATTPDPPGGLMPRPPGAPLTLQTLGTLRDALEAIEAGQDDSQRVRSGVQRRIYHLRRPSTSPPLRSSASAPSLRSGYVTPDSAVQRERAARAAEREAERAQDAAMERARRLTVLELADKLRRGAAI